MIYDALSSYVQSSVNAFYKSDAQLATDMYLEHFFKEVHDEDKGDIKGFPARPESR